MPGKIAVAVIHGVGKTDLSFADALAARLRDAFADLTSTSGDALEIASVYWAPILTPSEDLLWQRMRQSGELDFSKLRRFLIDFAADAIAYQPTPHDRHIYDGIHRIFARTLRHLAVAVGGKAPLCIIAHSLGSVIASNYIYDLQVEPRKRIISPEVRKEIGRTPLERGQTFTLFYTLGSPIAIWSLRYEDFGTPIQFPAPALPTHHPRLGPAAEWINFYDRDDIIGFPVKSINTAYRRVVKEDRMVNAGGWLTSWNPSSHLAYWTDADVVEPIARGLARAWSLVSPA